MSNEEFTGFSEETVQFFRDLSINNDREWFNSHRPTYEGAVLEPSRRFIIDLGRRLIKEYPTLSWGTQTNGSGSLMRIYRDIRFSPDKKPYKENLGIMFPLREGKKVEQPIFYFHIDAQQSFFYGGQHIFPKELLPLYREAVAHDEKGTSLVSILDDLGRGELGLMEDPHYKRVPRGYGKDHPRESLLRHTGLGMGIPIGQDLLFSRELIDTCLKAAVQLRPLMDWLLNL